MTTSKANPQVDAFIASAKTWQQELKKLRTILLDSDPSSQPTMQAGQRHVRNPLR
jgi:uncharacterized protein YdeI (YjbR/CyaY-like superfamily)